MRAKDVMPVPTERVEQKALMRWAKMHEARWPELRLIYHVPNEGQRSAHMGAELKEEGLKPGVPDVCLPVARGGCHGLYIELKRVKGGRVTPEQAVWIDELLHQGYAACVCRGWEEAVNVIEQYMTQD